MDKETKLREYCRRLRLPAIAQNYQELALQAQSDHLSHEEYLLNLLERESSHQDESQVRRLINAAGFPLKKTLLNHGLMKQTRPTICRMLSV